MTFSSSAANSSTGDAFYVPLGGGRFRATDLTRGPWSANSQHAGPPAALLGRAVERHDARQPTREADDDQAGMQFRVSRMTFEILRPVPLGELSVSARSAELGRSIQRVEANLTDAQGRVAMRASALRIRVAPASVPEIAVKAPDVPAPQDCADAAFFPIPWDSGYHTAMEVRFAAGAFMELGPATAWFRMRVPLVAGEEVSGLCRVLAAADSGNGISSELDFRRYLFINADLSVHLRRPPAGEWVGLDSRTTVDADGIGLTDTLLQDEHGPIGRASQSLFVAERR